MEPEQAKYEIAKELCHRFVSERQSSPRRPLVIRFKDPAILDQMEHSMLCSSRNNRHEYLPTLDSFGLLDNGDPVLDRARLGTITVLRLLRHLYELEDRKTPYAFEDLLQHADEKFGTADQELLQLGLYLIPPLGALGSWGPSESTEVKSFMIAERVMMIDNPEALWDERMKSARERASGRFQPGIQSQDFAALIRDYGVETEPEDSMSNPMEPAIPDHIRRDILDDLLTQDAPVQGRTDLISFLRRAWNLRELPSQDHRFENAERDIWQHMVNNSDWSAESLYVERLGILDCPDAQFIRFIEAVVHPLVRSSEAEQQRYVSLINARLEPLNWKIFPSRENPRRYVVGLNKLELSVGLWDRNNNELEEPEPDKFELVLSFAGEDREYVEKVAEMLASRGVTLFYDRYQKATLWGKDLYEHLNKVYGGDARYCVMFISKSYADKVWTTHERRSAFAAAIERREEYILPARFDDTEIEGLRKTIGYVDLRQETVDSFVELILQKLGKD